MDFGVLKGGLPNSQEFWRTRARRGPAARFAKFLKILENQSTTGPDGAVCRSAEPLGERDGVGRIGTGGAEEGERPPSAQEGGALAFGR